MEEGHSHGFFASLTDAEQDSLPPLADAFRTNALTEPESHNLEFATPKNVNNMWTIKGLYYTILYAHVLWNESTTEPEFIYDFRTTLISQVNFNNSWRLRSQHIFSRSWKFSKTGFIAGVYQPDTFYIIER